VAVPVLAWGLGAVAVGVGLYLYRDRLDLGGAMLAGKPGKYFDYREFQVTRTGLPNVMPASARANVDRLVQRVLDPLREHYGAPIRITSGYRSPQVNAAIGGSKSSDHLTGSAADFVLVAPTYNAVEVARRIVALGLPFDQVIAYAPERGGHVHVGLRAGANRRQALYALPGVGFAPLAGAP
jgi:zinc D-Ala-D-Ala carboxypeptidase